MRTPVIKDLKNIIPMLCVILFTFQALASEELENKLDDLNIPSDQITPLLSQDNLSVINTRYSSLINRHEITMAGGHNLTSDSHLDTKQVSASYRYHLNSRWSLGLRYNRYSNKLTSAGELLFDNQQIVPDADFAFNSQELFVNFNTLYGKLRWSSQSVVYFDQYISLGGGRIDLASGKANHALVDLGLAFWMGKHMSMRIGIKNEFYNQQQRSGERFRHNGMGYLEVGYLFGQGNKGQ